MITILALANVFISQCYSKSSCVLSPMRMGKFTVATSGGHRGGQPHGE